MPEITKMTGREYIHSHIMVHADAQNIIIAMGSVTETIKETVDYLAKSRAEKLELLQVHLYRPFSPKYFFKILPPTVNG